MINNAILQTESSRCASNFDHTIQRNPFLPVQNDIPARESLRTGDSEQVLKVAGYREITAANCHRFLKAACAAWKGHTDVEIDLSKTTFVDCAGLGALIAVRNLTNERKGMARLLNPPRPVQQLLEATRTGKLFDIVNTPHAALVFGPVAHN